MIMKKVAVKKETSSGGRKAPASPGSQVLLTETQAAEVLQLTGKALAGWRYRGGGPRFVRVSRRCVRYRLADINEWIAERLRTSTSDPGPQGKVTDV